MIKQCVLFLTYVVLTIHQSSALTNAARAAVNLEELLKKNPACKQIKCPSISDPMCVKLKYVTSALEASTVYVVMINKCEIKYVTCYEGVDAKEVPMKYCDHGKNISNDLIKLQAIIQEKKKLIKSKSATWAPLPVLVRRKRKAAHSRINQLKSVQLETKKTDDTEKRNTEMKHLNNAKDQLFQYLNKGNNKIIDHKGQSKQQLAINKDKDEKVSKLNDSNEDKTLKLKINANSADDGATERNAGDVEALADGNNEQQWDISDRIDYVIHSGEQELEDVNMEQYEQSCPTICPARGVMCCGKCKDGIYRTFLSPCHMRMFDCAHQDEKLTVISWAPCAMSGPYLNDLREPTGRLDEPNDDDAVLRYLKCKEYEKKYLQPYSRVNCTEFGLIPLAHKQKQTTEYNIKGE